MAIQFRIPVEGYIIEALKAHKASTSLSTQAFIESEFIGLHRNKAFGTVLGENAHNNFVLAPPTNSTRIIVRLSDPGVLAEINKYCSVLKRTQPQILYTLLKHIIAGVTLEEIGPTSQKIG